jgi:DNA uptake protein ComE-like DNA-binding protein
MLIAVALVSAASADDKKKPTPAPAETKEKVAVVDINHASQQELEKLPGVGTDYCHHIILYRPYETTDQLVTKNVLPQEVYDKIKDRIVAKQDAPAKKK